MFVSGFTIVRNAVLYDYPVVESIRSILPLVDEFVVCLGNSTDETATLIRSIESEKIRIVPSVWDDSLRAGGRVLAVETDKAFAALSPQSDWAFYLQADEIVHEQDHAAIRAAMLYFKDDEQTEGLLFKYLHFYGSYEYIGSSRRWYRREIRIIRNDKQIASYRDAQGFRKAGQKLKVRLIDAYIYHYGWVKHPEKQKSKEKNFNRYWHSDQWMKEKIKDEPAYDYSRIDALQPFEGTHPAVMQQRVAAQDWTLNFDTRRLNMAWKERLLYNIERWTGLRLFEYKNYKLLSTFSSKT